MQLLNSIGSRVMRAPLGESLPRVYRAAGSPAVPAAAAAPAGADVPDGPWDLAVIGAGPGGYVAAIRAAQLGMKVVVIERNPSLGGTCLNVGCIPSKALLDSSEFYARIEHEGARHGISVAKPTLDIPAMQKRKEEVVRKLTSGVASLMKGNKIGVIQGSARFGASSKQRDAQGLLGLEIVAAPAKAVWDANDTSAKTAPAARTLRTKNILIASGSIPGSLPMLPFDGTHIISSTEALALPAIPKRLVVVGAGAIGLEMGSVYARLGSTVTVIEAFPHILNNWDKQVQTTVQRELTKQGFTFHLGAKISGGKVEGSGKTKVVRVQAEASDGSKLELEADVVLVAAGRKAFIDQLGLESVGVTLANGGRTIGVDGHFKTSADGIYAIGDAIGGLMLAHKAEDEGVAFAELLAGKAGHVNYAAIPGVVYTWPEAATVGKTEEQLTAESVPYKKGTFNIGVNGRALAMDATAGFVKILAHAETDRVLGAHIVGPWASDLISEITVAMELGGSAEDIGRICHAHPTLPEAVKEAALAVGKRAIHGL